MAHRNAKPCSAPGCPKTVTGRGARCEQHVRAKDTARGIASARGYDNRWLEAKSRFLRDHQTCMTCESLGKITKATTVDHIRPHRGDDGLFWDETNWQPICASCHSKKTASETGARHIAQLVTLERRPCTPVIVVCGPSSALSRAAIKSSIRPDDMVIELDSMLALISGLPMYECISEEWIRKATLSRNYTLRALGGIRVPWRRTFFITPAPRASDRRHWRNVLEATVIVLEVPPDVVATLIANDEYGSKDDRTAAAYDWWAHYVVDSQDKTVRVPEALAAALD